jgi:hypothetical protein
MTLRGSCCGYVVFQISSLLLLKTSPASIYHAILTAQCSKQCFTNERANDLSRLAKSL